MRNKVQVLGVLLCGLLLSSMAQATLLSRLGGAAAYDDVLDITWLTNANELGAGNWATQLTNITSLNTNVHLGFSDWRLASMSVAAGVPTGTAASVVDCSLATEPDCRDNELGYMFIRTWTEIPE